MISGSRFLCAAALAAALALALASGAVSATSTWKGGDGNWSVPGNWDGGIPAAGDKAVIPKNVAVQMDVNGAQVNILELGDDLTLTITFGNNLTLSAGGSLHAFGNATVKVVPDNGLKFAANNDIAVDAGKTLAFEGAGSAQGVADALTLSGADADADLELGQDSSLDLRGDLTLGALKTEVGGKGTIAVAASKTLTLKNGADTDIELPVTGHLKLEPTAGAKVALNKKAQTVTFKGNAAVPLLALCSAEGLGELRLEGGNPDEVTIRPEADMTVGVLSCSKLKECALDFDGVKRALTVGSLNPDDGAEIDIDNGPGALKIGTVSAPGDWGLSLEAVELDLPGGNHKGLAL